MDSSRNEHILVCLSSAPSNARIIETAAKMAHAFGADFTALYVETPDADRMLDADKRRLQEHIHLAETLGAVTATIYGDDIALQIAEFSRLSSITKVVMGRSVVTKKRLLRKPTLTDRLIALAPDIDIHIIPDPSTKPALQRRLFTSKATLLRTAKDLGVSAIVLTVASLISFGFHAMDFTDANVITVYILAVLLTSVLTNSPICWVLTSAAGVLLFNFFFTAPQFTLLAYGAGYPVTFLVMLIASLATGSIAAKMKSQARQSTKAAYRTKILLDTSRMLSQARNAEKILSVAKEQIGKLLGQEVLIYAERPAGGKTANETADEAALLAAFERCAPTGHSTDLCKNADRTYYPIHVNRAIYGVASVTAEKPVDPFTESILFSMLGECALALENEKNAKAKEEAAILAEHERLRANLLRTISHDLRTPLTSISGNAGNLLANDAAFDEQTRKQIYSDIYEDSRWLISLVENLLSVTRIEDGKTRLHLSTELVGDVIEEALRHVGRCERGHTIRVEDGGELTLAKMDARLIVQVVVNLVDNAVKYTPDGSHVTIFVQTQEDMVRISVADDGNGVPDDMKPRVFDMFYTGANAIADSRRSLGLGLALCRSIVKAHGGEITVGDNQPHGAVFTFTLPKGSVEIHE
ncbi:MAG: ATP-binding protein [Christensenellaceae bacterium]